MAGNSHSPFRGVAIGCGIEQDHSISGCLRSPLRGTMPPLIGLRVVPCDNDHFPTAFD